MNKKITHVWYNNEKWEIVEYLKPTKYDIYLLVKRVRTDQVHFETKINPVEMRLIDCDNEEFYPSTIEVENLMSNFLNGKQINLQLRKSLSEHWLSFVNQMQTPKKK